jgi:two-component system sensor histidine kinase/response regulator
MTMERTERVLIVDDDPRNVRLLEGIFRSAGYSVDKAHSGAEALELVGMAPPDLILLDVMMPGMSGHEICVRLKADEATRSIPVVLVTALSAVEDKVEGLDLGADDFVSKPVNRIELLAKSRSLLRIKSLHDQVAGAKRQLEAQNEQLLKVERMKETLVQMIVHDLKNPLTAIMGNLSLILRAPDAPPEKTTQRAKVALESSRAMMRLTLDLLDVSKMEEDKMTLSYDSVALLPLVQGALTENESLLLQSKISVRNEVPADLHPALADRELIGRVIGNLLSNAIKHTPEGGSIVVGARSEGPSIVFFVRDTGEGIPEAFHEMIFDKFAQAEVKKLGLKSDRGLGLTFCKLAVEAHGGRIWVESAEGRGSTFFVSLQQALGAEHERRGELVSSAV